MIVTSRDVLTGEIPPGVYRTRARPATLRHTTERHGWRFFLLDGRAIHDKTTLLDAAARAMDFPSYFGQNWDALFDNMRDLSWAPAPGYVLLFDHITPFIETHPDEWATFLELLSDVTSAWQANNVPFYVLLRGLKDMG